MKIFEFTGGFKMISKAIICSAKEEVRFVEVQTPQMTEDDVVVQLEYSAITPGTEKAVLKGQNKYPFVLGYLSVGIVVDAGKNAAKKINIGDRVAFFSAKKPKGYEDHWMCGHMSRAVVYVPEQMGNCWYCLKVPEGISSEEAALAGLGGVSSIGADLAQPKCGDKVLILGQGMIGMNAMQHFKLKGADVAVSDVLDMRLNISKKLGADFTINVSENDLVDQLKSFWPDGADIVVDTTSNYNVIKKSLDAIKPGGKYVFENMCNGPGLDTQWMMRKASQAFFPNGVSPEGYMHTMKMIIKGGYNVKDMITHRFKPEEAKKAYDILLNKPEEGLGITFDWRDIK